MDVFQFILSIAWFLLTLGISLLSYIYFQHNKQDEETKHELREHIKKFNDKVQSIALIDQKLDLFIIEFREWKVYMKMLQNQRRKSDFPQS